MPIVGSVPGFLARMRTFDQRARELLNEVGLFNKFALPSVAPGPTNNNCDHQLLLSQYQGASCLVNVSMLWVLSTLEKYSSPSRKNISYAVQQKLSTGIIIHISNPSNLYNTYVALLINTTLTPPLTEHFLLPILYVSQTSRVGRLNPLHSEVCNNIPCSQVTFPDNT